MTESRTMVEQLTNFNKIMDAMENTEVKLEEEDKNLLILNTFPKTYEHFKDICYLGRSRPLLFRRCKPQ